MKLVFVYLTVAAAAALAQEFGPDIVMGRYHDVTKAAPRYYRVTLENDKTRVLSAELPPYAGTPAYDERAGLLVAITDLHLLYRTTDGRVKDVAVPAGGTQAIDAGSHSVENLGGHSCEFLFIEMKRQPNTPH